MTKAPRRARSPKIPTIPKPGITKSSSANKKIPMTASRSSSQPASCTSQCPHMNKERLDKPITPGMPKPGVRSSKKIPSIATLTKSELTTGWVRKRTTSSAQFGVKVRISGFWMFSSLRSASIELACRSATLSFSASSVVSVSSLPFSLISGITTSLSTIASAIRGGRLRLSAVARNSLRT